MKTEQLKIAKAISFIGHPLLTIPLFVAVMMFVFEDFEKALLNSALIIGCIFLPLFLRMYIKSRNGTYTNFDVSDRIQRKTLFTFIIPLMIVVTVISFKTSAASNFSLSILFGTIPCCYFADYQFIYKEFPSCIPEYLSLCAGYDS